MSKFAARNHSLEIMDDLNSSPKEVDPALGELETINTTLGGYTVVTDALEKLDLKGKSITISDWGCGGGDMLRYLANWSVRKQVNATMTGIDASKSIISYAKKQSRAFPNIKYIRKDVFDLNFQPTYDISLASLFCHHFDDESLVKLIRKMYGSSSMAVIINDLHRHWFAYYAIKVLTRFFSKSDMVKNDGPLSVLRAFKKNEFKKLLHEAGVKNYRIRWKWAFRWQVILYK